MTTRASVQGLSTSSRSEVRRAYSHPRYNIWEYTGRSRHGIFNESPFRPFQYWGRRQLELLQQGRSLHVSRKHLHNPKKESRKAAEKLRSDRPSFEEQQHLKLQELLKLQQSLDSSQNFLQRYKAKIVVGGIIALCCVGTSVNAYATWLARNEGDSGPLDFIRRNFVCSTENVKSGRWWVILTTSVTHFNPVHLLINMSALQSLGPSFIEVFGTRAFVGTWIVSAVAGSLGSLYWEQHPRETHEPPTMGGAVGASTSLFGLMFALLCFQPTALVSFPILNFWFPAYRYGLFLFGGSIYCLQSGALPSIGHGGHLGGMLSGVAAYYTFLRPLIRI